MTQPNPPNHALCTEPLQASLRLRPSGDLAPSFECRFLFVATALVLVPVELLCAESAIETQGEVMQGLLTFMVGCNLIPALLFWWRPRVALAALLFLFALIVPYQLVLLNRLTRINNEVMRIVDSRLRLRATGARLPVNLNDYAFKDPFVSDYIYHYKVSDDFTEFSLYYFVIQPGTMHWYDSKHGWDYYPD